MAKSQALNQLKAYFKNRDDVLMAFLFGSQSKGQESQRSDWDIGVYLKPPGKSKLEWEGSRLYKQKTDKIWGDLIDKLHTDNVDLVILNSAPAHTAHIIIKGLPLIIKDKSLYLEFMSHITDEAIDYCQMVNEYADIYWRSKSLSIEDAKNLKTRLIFLENEIREFAKFKTFSQQKYIEDRDSKRNVERWVENLVNCALDISKILLASAHQDVPDTYKEIFLKLSVLPKFSSSLAKTLANWAGLRNIIAHEYLDLRWHRQIKPFVDTAEPYLKSFIKAIKKYLER